MKFRRINVDDNFIGIIGIDNQGLPFHKAEKRGFDGLLKSLIIPVRVDFSGNENTVSMSYSKIIPPAGEDWLFYMQFNLPSNIYAEEIQGD